MIFSIVISIKVTNRVNRHDEASLHQAMFQTIVVSKMVVFRHFWVDVQTSTACLCDSPDTPLYETD